MRSMLAADDQSLVPAYTEVADTTQATIKRIEETIPYPMIIKPSGLEGSLLVSLVQNRTELRATLKQTFAAMQASYEEWVKWQKPAVLVEEFMVGKKYVMDTYVAADGTCQHAPLITSTRGIEAGFDDFFEYSASLPPEVDKTAVQDAQRTAEQACRALGFRSVTADVELMRTAKGWKIIELTPRMGGYCHDMYSRSYGINHIVNDILNRAGEKPDIPDTLQNYTAVFDVYARKEGTLSAVDGLDKVRSLPSFTDAAQHIQVGEPVTFAKHGGDSVFYFVFSHADKDQLASGIATMERALELQVS